MGGGVRDYRVKFEKTAVVHVVVSGIIHQSPVDNQKKPRHMFVIKFKKLPCLFFKLI